MDFFNLRCCKINLSNWEHNEEQFERTLVIGLLVLTDPKEGPGYLRSGEIILFKNITIQRLFSISQLLVINISSRKLVQRKLNQNDLILKIDDELPGPYGVAPWLSRNWRTLQ